MGSFYMEATQINYRRDETFKTVDQKLQELSETSAIDTDIAPVFKSTNTYAPGDMVYYRNKLYVFNVEHTGAWAAGDVTATDVTTAINNAAAVKADEADIAPAFDATASYTAGDLVYYGGIIYRCTNDHSGDWDADDFSVTTISAELGSLKSGLTNVNAALDAPNGTGKNLLKVTASSTSGGGVTFTVDSDGTISLEGTATETVILTIATFTFKANKSYILSGCPANGSTSTYLLSIQGVGYDSGESYTYTPTSDQEKNIVINIYSGTNVDGKVFSPMIRPAGTTSDFTPYIPSVESRIEAVESNLLYFGKGTHDFNKTVYCGYISGSGNYLDFFVPCKYDNTISTVTLNNSALMSIYTFDGTLLTQGYIDLSGINLEKTIGGLRIELKFNNTQTTYINTIANVTFGFNSLFTFA